MFITDGGEEWTEASVDTYNTQDVEYVSVDSTGCMYLASRSYTYTDEAAEEETAEETSDKEHGKLCEVVVMASIHRQQPCQFSTCIQLEKGSNYV